MIDAHLHLWDPERLDYDWLAHVPAIAARHAVAEWARLDADVEQAVFVQADCRPEQALKEADWIGEIGGAIPVGAVVAFAPLELGGSVREHLTALGERPLVRGVRRATQNEADGFMSRPDHIDGLTLAAQSGLSIDVCVRDRQLPELLGVLRALFERAPDACVVLDHLGKPDIASHDGDPDGADWRASLSALARLPGVFAKISGLTTQDHWTALRPDVLTPYIDHALTCFGPERLMFGSDWPVVNLAGSHDAWRAIFQDAIAGLSATEQSHIRSETARRVYRLAGANTRGRA
jgi:L-fuconolactonase